jgi:signal transduction histidine kinase
MLAIIPIGLLSWMGIAGFQSEIEQSKQKIEYLGNQRLEIIRESLNGVFPEFERELNSILVETGKDIEKIRTTQRNYPIIKQIFILNEDGLIFPNYDIPLSDNESSFLSRIQETDISYNFLQKSKTENSADTLKSGWHTWFMGDGLNFIYWQKIETSNSDTVISGIELNRSSLLSRIINKLPITNEKNFSIRISLLNISGSIIYQWGAYSPLKNKSSDYSLPLNNILSSWSLEYYIDPDSINSRGEKSFLIISLLTILLIIIALSIYLYRESTREIREASQKVSFVNQVSHELKTPLTNIRLYAELLEKRFEKEDRKTKKHLNIIISESSRLSRLINNVLSFAKDRKNGIIFTPVPAVPDEIIKQTIDSFTYSLKTRGITVQTKLMASDTVVMDTDIFEQILSNLISNVEKYAASGKCILIETELVGDILFLIVSDHGPGIPLNLKEKIFEPFYRISNRLTDGVSGTGIGLSLVRILAEIHGGSVDLITSSSLSESGSGLSGKGAVFQVKLSSAKAGL